jgi:hypothetical protein
VRSLASVTVAGGTLHLWCFGDEGSDPGPHPVSAEELRAAFDAAGGWHLTGLTPDRLLTRLHGDDGAAAWRATVVRRTD